MGGFSVASIVVWGKGWECSAGVKSALSSSLAAAEIARESDPEKPENALAES